MQAFFWGGGVGLFSCVHAKRKTRSEAFLAETVESENKCRDVTSTAYSKDVELFRNGLVHEFYRLKALITLEQANISVVEKKEESLWAKLQRNFDGEANWSGVANESCDKHAVFLGND